MVRIPTSLALVAWGLALALASSAPLSGSDSSLIPFQHPGAKTLLDQGQISCITQDRRGFMWFGTATGLIRFDGYEAVAYTHDPAVPSTLGNNQVTCLLEDRQGDLWIGTANGLDRLDGRQETIRHFRSRDGDPTSLSHNHITFLFQDRQGRLWVGTQKGLNLWQPEGATFRRFLHDDRDPLSLADDRTQDMAEDGQGHLWIGCASGLSLCLKEAGGGLRFSREGKGLKSLQLPVEDLFCDGKGRLWLAAPGTGVFVLDMAEGESAQPKVVQIRRGSEMLRSISCIRQDRQGRMWFGTIDGIMVLDPESGRSQEVKTDPFDPWSVSVDNILSLHADRSGSMWVGTYGRGVNLWSPYHKRFSLIRHNPGNPDSLGPRSVRAVLMDGEGTLWVSGYNGLDRIDWKGKRYTHLKSVLPITGIVYAMASDRDEPGRVIWMGTESSGAELIQFDRRANGVLQAIDLSPLVGKAGMQVFAVQDDGVGSLWIGTSFGLIKWDKQSGRGEVIESRPGDAVKFSGHEVRTILRDNTGDLWLGTSSAGLFLYDPHSLSFQSLGSGEGEPSEWQAYPILCLAQDREGAIWIGTMGGGLVRFLPALGTRTSFSTKTGLPSNVVYGILIDHRDRLWLSTYQGISRFDPAKEEFRNFDFSDGLQGNEFNSNAYFRSPAGEMFFGGVNGLNAFFPDDVIDNPSVPPVVITGFSLFNTPLQPGQKVNGRIVLSEAIGSTPQVTLRHDENTIELSYSSLNYLNSPKNQYSYRMEGFDREWNPVASRRFALYTKLPPGRFRFRVRGSNNDGVWNMEGASIAIVILPPFWKQWWFFLLLGLAAFSLIYFGHRAQTRFIERRNRELSAINRELRGAQTALQKSEEKYRTLTDNIHAGIFRSIPEGDGTFVEANPTMVRIFGYSSREEMLGTSVRALYPSDEDRQRLLEKLERVGSVRSEEMLLKRKNGTLIWCSLTIVSIGDGEGRAIYHDGLIEDISERKRLESQLLQIQKMEAIGQLAGGIAHDFNNILTVIIGQSELLLGKLEAGSAMHHAVSQISTSGIHARDLISRLLAFSRKQVVEPKILDINQAITRLDSFFRRILGEDIQLLTQLTPNLPPIKADPAQLETVFMNIVLNSRDAIADAGRIRPGMEKRITIETSSVCLDTEYVERHPGSVPGHHVVIAVSDNGIGMSEEVKRKIFEPFFTTKPKEKGTGLGLSSVFGIVKQNSGSIYVYSELGQGTTFKIYWPVQTDQAASVAPLEPTVTQISTGTETILVVEDEESVREFIATALTSLGYTVITAENGFEALEKLSAKAAVDLIMTDVVMPRMGGDELARRAHEISPAVRILFCSGYTDNHITSGGTLEPGICFIQKPFTLQNLAVKVREALGGDAR